ncbi:hypothetical protein FSB73_08025 [Arachidicoccus ginsenosidivorans]|uniref:Uncharacterized protein n=1 Tax=Arachidicoccus ginsenosidivorans TaxID=496057 RepID=A0A5B8VKB0_9BACT|nr:hypothetical protein [Arachidicoccus ginsenosidivorans]QEC71623.1 hypothetical protein FSB73_08025 [Arachidicoccus ginsenosidivorans]
MPDINEKGQNVTNPEGHNIRIYTHLDIRLMLSGFYLKTNLFALTQTSVNCNAKSFIDKEQLHIDQTLLNVWTTFADIFRQISVSLGRSIN